MFHATTHRTTGLHSSKQWALCRSHLMDNLKQDRAEQSIGPSRSIKTSAQTIAQTPRESTRSSSLQFRIVTCEIHIDLTQRRVLSIRLNSPRWNLFRRHLWHIITPACLAPPFHQLLLAPL